MRLMIRKHTLKIVLACICIAAFGTALFFFLSWWENRDAGNTNGGEYPDYSQEVLYYQGQAYALKEGLETVLLLGVDKYESQTDTSSYNNSQQSDFLMLLILDTQTETYTALHLNRDTMTEITKLGVRGEKAGTFTGQLALAHTYGSGGKDSCRNVVDAVSGLLYGVEIDHYISVTMDAVPVVNDLVGGVEVEILDDFSSVDASLVKGTTVTLQGTQALAYVRTRKGLDDSSNLSRMKRQRQYLNALTLKMQTCMEEDSSFSLTLATKISSYMVSDYTVNQLSKLFDQTMTYEDMGITTLEGEAEQGEEFIEYYVNDDALRDFVISAFYEPYEEASQSQ